MTEHFKKRTAELRRMYRRLKKFGAKNKISEEVKEQLNTAFYEDSQML